MSNAIGLGRKKAFACWATICACALSFGSSQAPANAQSARPGSQADVSRFTSIEIVLPPRLVAGRPATLATLGADHKLIGHVPVELGDGTQLETDATGRVNFAAPLGAVLIAKAGGASAATLVDSASSANADSELRVPPFAALHSGLNLCGGGFDGNAEMNRVSINGEPSLVLAASPECLVVIPGPMAAPGIAKISIEGSSPPEQASLTLVSLVFEPPQPPLTAGEKGWLTVRARGSNQPLRIMVENTSFDVLQFEKGDRQWFNTSGGARNVARIRVQAIRSGDFSFRARVLPPPDPEAARRFLAAAESIAIGDLPRQLKRMENDLAHHPRDTAKIRADLDRMLEISSASNFRTLIEAARSAL
jgi:hypothetical protein